MHTTNETSAPLHKAYNAFEHSGLTYEQRMENYTGPMSPDAALNSNGFKQYINSGGISKKEDLTQTLNSIS